MTLGKLDIFLESSGVQANWCARIAKSGVRLVFRSVLILVNERGVEGCPGGFHIHWETRILKNSRVGL